MRENKHQQRTDLTATKFKKTQPKAGWSEYRHCPSDRLSCGVLQQRWKKGNEGVMSKLGEEGELRF
jgi:hypothetical protein